MTPEPAPDLGDAGSLPPRPLPAAFPDVAPELSGPDRLEVDGPPSAAEMANESATSEDEALVEWKAGLRKDFEDWLNSLDSIPVSDDDSADSEECPDLFSFYQQLAAANSDARKHSRRTAEALSQWGETLTRFESHLAPLREVGMQLASAQSKESGLPRAYCLVLVEWLDRLHRLAKAFAATPALKIGWFGNDRAWRQAWETQRQGLAILISHLEELFKKEGVARINTSGRAFDPSIMIAVATDSSGLLPANTVLEEITPGYTHRDQLLRPAQVKVSIAR